MSAPLTIVDDSDVDDPLSPGSEKDADKESTIEQATPLRTRSMNYADEFGIAPTSPTRQHLRRSHSTTMDKLKKRPKTCGSKITLKASSDKSHFDDNWDDTTRQDARHTRESDISFLSRDGDAVNYSSISISSPDFNPEEMPPPRSARLMQSPLAPTQPLSDDFQSLAMLVQQRTDDLPSTKPSSDSHGSGNGDPQISTQDAIAFAAELGEEILTMGDTSESGVKTRGRKQSTVESEDEMVQAASPVLESSVKSSKQSRKRTREVVEDETVASKPPKKRTIEVEEDEDIFAGFAKEKYEPRKSRSRASRADVESFSNIDFSKKPEDISKKPSSKSKKVAFKRRQTTGGAVVVKVDDDDFFEEVEEEKFTPAKSRSKRKSKIVKTDSEDLIKECSPESSAHPKSTSDAIVVADIAESIETAPVEHVEDIEKKSSKRGARKSSRARKGRQSTAKSSSSQDFSTRSIDLDDGSAKVQLNNNKFKTGMISTVDGEVSDDEENSRDTVHSAVEVTTVQDDTALRNLDHEVPPPVSDHEDFVVRETSKSAKGKKQSKKAAKKTTVEVVNLSSGIDASVEQDLGGSGIPTPVVTGSKGDLEHAEEVEKPADTEVKALPLTDKTNMSATDKPVTPEKIAEKGPTKHSPIKTARVPYRVGLSRRSRIEPLLKIVRKEKEVRAVGTKKKAVVKVVEAEIMEE